MNAYSGPCVVIIEDETEVAATADLRHYRNGLRTDWRGTLAPAPDGLKRVLNLTEGILRMPDGREARFVRPDTSDWVTNNQLSIIGQLDAPF